MGKLIANYYHQRMTVKGTNYWERKRENIMSGIRGYGMVRGLVIEHMRGIYERRHEEERQGTEMGVEGDC